MRSPSGGVCAMDATVDCDDTIATSYPSASEACNGRDDDCDGLLDDGVPVVTSDLALATTGDARSGLVALGPGGDDAGLVALVQLDTGTRPRRTVLVRRAGGAPVERELMARVIGPTALSPIDLGRGAEALAVVGERLVVLFSPEGSCRRLALAATDTGATRLDAPQSIHEAGVPTLDAASACQASSRGALAADAAGGGRFVAVYANPAGAACGAVSPSPVLAMGGTLRAAMPELEASAPIELGQTVDSRAPALVSAGSAGVYFVAFPTGTAIEIHRLDMSAGTTTPLHEEATSQASAVTLSLEGTTLSLGWSERCGAEPARVRGFTVAGATLVPGLTTALSRGADTLSVAWHPALEEWGVLLEDATGWALERHDDTGAPIGPPTPVRSASSDVLALVRARASGAAYEVFGAEASVVTEGGRLALDTVACLP